MNPHDHPDLTAHMLGELDAEHAEAMAQWIATNPEARAEAGQIGALAQHLRTTAPVPKDRLLPHQREAILSGPQLVRQMVAAASQPKKRPPAWVPVMQSIGRIAAAAVLIIAGFIAGRSFTGAGAKQVASTTPRTTSGDAKKAPTPVQQPFRAKEIVHTPAPESPSASQPAAATAPKVESPEKPAVAQEKIAVAEVSQPSQIAPAPTAPLKPRKPSTQLIDGVAMTTTKAAESQLTLHLDQTRPTAAAATSVAAAPIKQSMKPAAVPTPKKTEVRIHSWKAELASCPWDSSRRLMRLTVQVPGEQAAAHNASGVPLKVTFDQKYVRSYRQLAQREVPAAAQDSPAFHTMWFELVPNGPLNDATRDGFGRTIATVMIPNAKFTSETVGPFDASKLEVIDNGGAWSEASDDFLFESAVTGFGLLLKGSTQAPGLNHALVLDLAQRTIKNDRHGERAKFLKAVQEAQKAAGL